MSLSGLLGPLLFLASAMAGARAAAAFDGTHLCRARSRPLRVGLQLAFVVTTTVPLGGIVIVAFGSPLLLLTALPWFLAALTVGISMACRRRLAHRAR